MEKFLNYDGVQYLWENIKALLGDKAPIILSNMDSSNRVPLRSLESGTYILQGYFTSYEGGTHKYTFSTGMLVAVVYSSDMSYVQIFYPKNNTIQYLEISDTAVSRKDAKLINMESTANMVTEINEYSDDAHYPSALAVYNIVDTLSTRISTLLTELESNPDYAATAEVIDIRTGYDGTAHETAGDAVRAVGADLLELKASLQDYINKSAVDGLLYDETESKLYLTSGGEIVSDPVTIVSGSGGGSGSTSKITLTNEGDSAYNVAENTDVWLKFNFTSTEDGVATGSGTAKIIVNGATKASLTIPQGSNEINVKDYISAGENIVKVTCSDIYGSSKSLNYTVNVITLSITSTFDDSQVYSGDITFKYTPVGILSKTIHFEVDGEESTVIVEASGKQNTKIFPAMSHGSHKLVVYATAVLGVTTITSNRLVYDVMCEVDGNNTVIVASPFEDGNATEGDLLEIPFSVYDPANLTADVTLTIVSGGETYSTQNLTVDRTRQIWSTRQYPTETVKFTIACGSVSKTITMTVTELSIDVEAETADMELYLASAGRNNSESNPDVWENNGHSTEFQNINWVDTGWVADDNGDIALRLAGDARAVIGFTPFSTDARSTGKTIELDYLVRDVNNRDAVVIECMNGGIGIRATADRAFIKSEQSQITCYYKDEERVRVTFVIEPRTDYRLLSIYLNGILSGAVQYPDNDNFQQAVPASITLGSDYCALDFYKIRSYAAALTADQIRDNYIADTLDVNQKLALYQANDIYDSYGRLTFDKLVKRIPTMVITGALPTVKGDKKTVSIRYIDPFNSDYDFEDTASIDVQGTSSQWYVRKNWKIKTSNEYQVAFGQLPAKVWCMKADYAEATGTHNTGNANFAHTLYDVKTPPQEVDERVRTTIFGFPSVIFHKADESSEPEFIGKYNFNYDKGAENVFGFSSAYPLAECWEFCNNTSDACLFHGEVPDSWGDDFEARYPDKYKNLSAFKVMHSWVVSTWQDGATNAALGSTYTDVDGKTHTVDNAAYRLAKFKTEFESHFDKRFMLIYYVYTLVMLMVDQRAKNMFLTTWDGVHWQPWLYDNDTCLGINNEGQLVFDYYHEDIDKVGGANVYNGQDSALWVNFREAFWDEIGELYRELRSSGKLTFQKIYDAFITNQSDKWSISVYNEDADYKYISMLRSDNDASNLDQIRGSGKEHLGYFVDNRLKYLDSEFEAAEYLDNYATLRIYTPDTWTGVAPNADVTVTPFSNMYAGIRYKANGTPQYHRAEKNVPVTFNAPDETFNDTETAVFGASEISSLGDLSPLYCGSVKVANATKLTEIIVGSAVTGYSNPNMKELVVGTNRLLKKVDVRNCPNLVNPLALSGCPNIEEVYAEGTSITGVELPASGYLKTMHLPNTITNLTVRNQPYIEDFQCAGYGNLTTLRVENAPAIPLSDIVMAATKLNRVRLLNVDLTLEDTSVLDVLATCAGLDENNGNTDKPVVTGTAHVPAITQSQLAYYNEKLPDLQLVYDAYTAQYTVTFQNWDGTVLDVQYVEANGSAVEPIAAGRIPTPTKDRTPQYSYTFSKWNGLYTNVTGNRLITAEYTSTVNQYTVRFYNYTTILQTTTVDYGSSVVYEGLTPEYSGTDTGYFLFVGWSTDTSFVESDMDVHAMFEKAEVPATVTAFGDCTWVQIKAVAEAGNVNDNGDWEIDGVVWWSVGDEKTLTLSTGEEVVLQLWDFAHDDKPDGTKSKLTIGTKGLLTDTMTQIGKSWRLSDAREYLNETIYSYLPSDLIYIITDVNKNSLSSDAETVEVTIDKLFIPSPVEVAAENVSYMKEYISYEEGHRYPIFTDNNSRIKKNNDTAYEWWIRSTKVGSNMSYRIYISEKGEVMQPATNSINKRLCFAFCI